MGKNTIIHEIEWTPELVKKFWSGFSKTRLVELSFGRLASESFLLAIWSYLSRDGMHLDYGAGDGDIVGEVLKNGFRIAAYEPSEERKKVIVSKYRDIGNFLGIVEQSDSQLFDVVIVSEVIEHVLQIDFDLFLHDLNFRLKRGGKLILTTPNDEDLELNMVYCPVCSTLFHRWQHVRSFTQKTLQNTMERAGFETIAIHQVEFRDELFLPYKNYFTRKIPLPPRRGRVLRRLRKILSSISMEIPGKFNGLIKPPLPSYVYDFLENRSTRVGSGNTLLYIGKKLS